MSDSRTSFRTRYTDAAGGRVDYTYDAAGRLATLARWQDGSVLATSTYGYDTDNGERRGLPTSLTHTGSGRTITALGGYDGDGRLVTQSFPNVTGGLTQDWGYDPAGQATTLSWSGASGGWFSHQVTRTGLGQVAGDSNTASGRQRAYLYDGAGRLAAVDSQEAEGCVRTRYSWDANSNRVATLTQFGF